MKIKQIYKIQNILFSFFYKTNNNNNNNNYNFYKIKIKDFFIGTRN